MTSKISFHTNHGRNFLFPTDLSKRRGEAQNEKLKEDESRILCKYGITAKFETDLCMIIKPFGLGCESAISNVSIQQFSELITISTFRFSYFFLLRSKAPKQRENGRE